ncbi:ankyrin repeat-containing domain protein [Russula aff. rugulosa BPL654]|nr:ankyrin repeat-containing domain protein [Russula aff. rugulosa BPL654]
MNADGGHYVRPLVAALAGEHFQTADLLRDKGADLDIRGFYGKNPLHGTAQSGNLKVIRKLIEYNPAYINDGDGNEETPLHWASRGHDRDGSAVRLLLEHGADVNAQSSSGLKLTALHLAAEGGKQEVMRVLLEHGANVGLTNNYCQTASQAAAYDLRWETVEFLRKYEAK